MGHSIDDVRPRSVLVVDDEPAICDLCRDGLSNVGFTVEAEVDPRKALHTLHDQEFDLLLSDIRMPELDGIGLVRHVRTWSPDLPIVLMTAYASLDLTIDALNEGATSFLRKPFDLHALVEAVNRALARRKSLQEKFASPAPAPLAYLSDSLKQATPPAERSHLLLQATVELTHSTAAALFAFQGDDSALVDSFNPIPGRTFHRLARQAYREARTVFHPEPSDPAEARRGEPTDGVSLAVPCNLYGCVTHVLCLHAEGPGFQAGAVELAEIMASSVAAVLNHSEAALDREILFLETVKALAAALDQRDAYTCRHSRRVAQIAVAIGREMGLSCRELQELELAGTLHDIGKIGIPDAVLQKSGRLNPTEYQMIQEHPVKGYRILKSIQRLARVSEAVYSHHERYDGTGYPRGLRGEDIPVAGAIVAVADTLDTLMSNRRYRKKKSFEAALRIIEANSGSQFHPRVVAALKRVDRARLPV